MHENATHFLLEHFEILTTRKFPYTKRMSHVEGSSVFFFHMKLVPTDVYVHRSI